MIGCRDLIYRSRFFNLKTQTAQNGSNKSQFLNDQYRQIGFARTLSSTVAAEMPHVLTLETNLELY